MPCPLVRTAGLLASMVVAQAAQARSPAPEQPLADCAAIDDDAARLA